MELGKLFSVSIFGESHGMGVGATVNGCPANLELKIEDIQKEADRKNLGKVTWHRKEKKKI